MAEENVSPKVADRFKMPDIYESGIRGNQLSPKARSEKAAAEKLAKEAADKKGKKAGKGKGAADADEEQDEEESDEKPVRKKKGGYVLISKAAYDKHIGSKKKAKK